MGFFQHKQKTDDSISEDAQASEQHFLDANFREELRNHGRLYFEKVIGENGELFKKDLDATITQINTELKEHVSSQLQEAITQLNSDLKQHVTEQLDAQFSEYTKTAKEAQDHAFESLNQSVATLQDQHKQLGKVLEDNVTSLQKSVTDQEALMSNVIQGNMARILETKNAQDVALESLNKSVAALEEQQQTLTSKLEENVAKQEDVLVSAFEENMAQIIEHYLLGALGDQYDLKAQLPSIIQQMESNKQAIADDMKL